MTTIWTGILPRDLEDGLAGRVFGAASLLALALSLAFGTGTMAQQLNDSTAADSTVVETDAGSALNPAWSFLNDLFAISTQDLGTKALRIVAIALVVAVARVFMLLMQKASRFVVFSDWGPLRHVFRNHQRSITAHNLLISFTKYVVYLMALGYILKELGVDYRAYLASLSLIGIALGFGSQGLVQDVVTGFFILFENQFTVGDMVEISGQVGIVESIGLRTTVIRNYLGARIVLQNRNIPMAVRYPKGAVEAAVDVAVASIGTAEKAAGVLARIGAELHKQFPEIIMKEPRIEGLVALETDESFVRLHCEIWPAQQWVIDAQMVPRIREIFKREELEIPSDRVVSFYHLPESEDEAPGILRRLRLLDRGDEPPVTT